jgi:hypothetical protein
MAVSTTPPMPEQDLESVHDKVIDTVTVGQQEILVAVESAGRAFLEGMSTTRQEIADFLAERIRQDLDTQQAMLRCRSLDEFREIQAGYLKTALSQYGSEASRLMRLGSKLAAKSLERGPA